LPNIATIGKNANLTDVFNNYGNNALYWYIPINSNNKLNIGKEWFWFWFMNDRTRRLHRGF
jgi:hypothetical protein